MTSLGSDSRPRISVVIHAFNAAESLQELVQRMEPELREQCTECDVTLVNDGQRNALLVGIRAAEQDLIITMDDDLQHPPEEISTLIAALIVQKAKGAETARRIDAFRILRRVLREGFTNFSGPLVSIDGLLTWFTNRFGWVHVAHEAQKRGESNYTFNRLDAHALKLVTGFSTLPLQIASWIGFSTLIFGFLAMAYALVRNLIEGAAPAGFPFLVSSITFFSGAQLMALGIIGEYLARAHFRIMDRPAFVVR